MPESKFKSAAILGSGSFGTALAKLLAPKMETILLIGRDCVTADSINLYHRNPHYLSNIQLQDNVRASIETNDALAYSLLPFQLRPHAKWHASFSTQTYHPRRLYFPARKA